MLADVVAKSLSMILEKSWKSSEVPGNWSRGNTVLVFKMGEPGNYCPVSLASLPGKIMEQILLEAKAHGGRGGDLRQSAWLHEGQILPDPPSGLLNGLIASVEKRMVTDIIYLDFCKASDVVLNNILLSKAERSVFMGKVLDKKVVGWSHPEGSGQ
ncbi:hypothetical protein HGM15179_005383 [Zosterops borbonicus]|uniref:Uncharacterized protein n=1 Tax=Zosterops borbonicus TaxID=364589 RepID=A0A8K1GQ39_9PASS|nr:hypothetical protein HGM15179_005383 [Zosterops borbonicus]